MVLIWFYGWFPSRGSAEGQYIGGGDDFLSASPQLIRILPIGLDGPLVALENIMKLTWSCHNKETILFTLFPSHGKNRNSFNLPTPCGHQNRLLRPAQGLYSCHRKRGHMSLYRALQFAARFRKHLHAVVGVGLRIYSVGLLPNLPPSTWCAARGFPRRIGPSLGRRGGGRVATPESSEKMEGPPKARSTWQFLLGC